MTTTNKKTSFLGSATMTTTTKKTSFLFLFVMVFVFLITAVQWFSNVSLSKYSGANVELEEKTKRDESLTSAEVLLLLSNNNLTIAQVPCLFPKPNRQDTTSIYNRDAWIALSRVLTTRKEFSLCANGGSSTSGGGPPTVVGGQFYFKFIDYMNTTGVTAPDAKVDIIERGHGARNSLHSAMLAASFLPPHIDILLWEFAINDRHNGIRDNDRRRLEEKNELILWLEQVSKIKPRPPLVVLAYLWNAPFNDDIDGKVLSDNFVSHQRVAAEYEFVVGHVNLASYIDELQWGMELSRKFLLADKHHPSRMGHAVLAHLLLDLVVDEDRQVVTVANITNQKTPYKWACGTESTEKRLIQSRVDGKHPLASFTMELPRNDQVYPGMLVSVPSKTTKTAILGKQLPSRLDRKMGLIVPCCHDNQTLDFVVSHNKNITMQLIHLGMPPHPFGGHHPGQGIRVFLDSQQNSVAANLIITPDNWDCLWGKSNEADFMWSNMDWIALENEQRNISRIQFCSTGECCGVEFCKIDRKQHPGWVLESLVIY
jgi:hypothetical protein